MGERKGIALVTGGSRGIGRAIAERLARDGFFVVPTYNMNQEAAEDVAAVARQEGGRAVAMRCDVASSDSINALFSSIDLLGEPLQVVVGNAAVFAPGTLDAYNDEMFSRIIGGNVRAPVILARTASSRLIRGGKMIFVSSVSAMQASPTHVLYSMSKAALGALVRALAAEWGPRGIGVNAVMPGLTDTDMAAELCAVLPPQIREFVADSTALRRIGQPADIAAVTSFLAGQDSAWITGQVINCTGGYRL